MIRLQATRANYGRRMRLCGCSVALGKARGTPVVHKTRVSRYVAENHPEVTAKILARFTTAKDRGIAKLKALRKVDPATLSDEDAATVDEIIAEIDPEGLAGLIVDDITPDMIDAYKTAGVQGVIDVTEADPLPDITSHIDVAALQYIEDHGAELVTQLDDTTLTDLRAFLGESLAEGMGTDELAVALDDFGIFSEARAMTIARTELAFAHVQGNMQGWSETGLVDKKKWLLGDNHDVPDECDDAEDAGEVGIDSEFGDTGLTEPPAHPNCVCDVVPILADPIDDPGDENSTGDDGEQE